MSNNPAFPLSVDYVFWAEIASIAGKEFADSYLYGAVLEDGRLLPRTVTAHRKLSEQYAVMNFLRREKVWLVQPPPFNGTPAVEELGLQLAPTQRRRAA